MRLKLVSALALLLLFDGAAVAREKPSLPEADRVRIAEAFRLGRAVGGRVWKGWGGAPFALLLVTPEHEFLVRHPSPSKDFEPAGYDPLLRSEVFYRKRVFGTHLLATFPAVGGVPTIVIGQAENTQKKSSTPWVVTVLHEHFHQLQSSQPHYYSEVDALGLARGDQTGMWMLNYAFPYSSPEVARRFGELCRLLAEAIRARPGGEFDARAAAYLDARREFAATLEPDDYRYFSFQVWQEGLARYTEYRVARLAADAYRPSREFRALKDYKPFGAVADEIMDGIMKELATLKLEDYRRVAFYPLGAGEALLLDRANPAWKDRYLSEKFYVERYFAPLPRPKRRRAG